MKKIITLFILFLGLASNAQIVNIPDQAFKAFLIDMGFDTNNDGEIQVSEAQAQTQLNIFSSTISSLEGIQSFTNLQYFEIYFCPLVTTIDLSSLNNLSIIRINETYLLNSILITSPVLTELKIVNSSLTSLDLSSCPNINHLDLDSNNLSSIIFNPSTSTNLQYLNLYGNQLTSFDLPFHGSELDLSNNQFTSFDFSNIHMVQNGIFYFSNNPITSLNLSQLSYANGGFSFISSNNPNLTSVIMPTNVSPYDTLAYLQIGGPSLNFVDFKNDNCDVYFSQGGMPFGYGGADYSFSSNTNIYYCVDEGCGDYSFSGDYRDEEFYFSHLGLFSDTPLNVNTPRSRNASPYCSFLPGGEFNTIQGSVTWDCGNSNVNMPNVKLNFGSPNEYTFSNDSGNFVYYLGQGNYTLTPQFENSGYFTISPANYNFNLTSTGNTETANFCISPNGVHNDLNLTLIPISVARPGFDAEYILALKNNGNQTQSGTVSLTFDDAKADYVSSLPNITSQNSNFLNWDFTGLEPFETKIIHVTLNVNSPTETPAVNIGDVLEFSSEVTSLGTDETPSDNLYSFNQVVVGSYDPNDKQVVEGSQVDISNSGDYLTYIARFQNTGNFVAENVVVKDYLSSYLDANSLQIVSSSHPFRSTLTQNKRLEFFFEGINLPASSVDEAGSHGYICFKIKPINTVSLGTTINNNAAIYFDYNNPIITNTVSTTFTVLGNNDLSFDSYFNLSPNPTSSILNLYIKNQVDPKSVEIYNPLGQLVLSKESDINSNNIALDVSGLKDGVYVISINTNKGKTSKRFIKK